MALGQRGGERQEELWIPTASVARGPGHPFYDQPGALPTAVRVGRFRMDVVYTGSAFSADHHDAWTYNDRNELTGTTRRAGTTVGSGTETTGARRVYAYDNIGNRDTYTKGTGAQTTYESNQLNQYENVETASSPVTAAHPPRAS